MHVDVEGHRLMRLTIFLRLYLFTRDTEREAETQAEGEAGSMLGVS